MRTECTEKKSENRKTGKDAFNSSKPGRRAGLDQIRSSETGERWSNFGCILKVRYSDGLGWDVGKEERKG